MSTRARQDTIDTAWHEAGHAVVAIALGIKLSGVYLTGERARLGRIVGRTKLDGSWVVMIDPDQRDMDIKSLAGDAVDDRRGVRGGRHILAVVDRRGHAVFDERWAEARKLVDLHWPSPPGSAC